MKENHQERFIVTHPLPVHFKQIQNLCKKVYPFHRPWTIGELESHRSYFPDGQLIVVDKEEDKVVGLAFSLIITWNDYSPQDNWLDYTSGGHFHNHDPKKGKTLYGAEVMVDPEYRGMGIGKILYQARREIADRYQLKRIRAGARLRGYSKFQGKLSPQEYTKKVITKEISDPTLSFQLAQGFKVIDVATNYILNDPESLGHAAVIEWVNPQTCTESEINKHEKVAQAFLNEDNFTSQYLPKELKRLVRKVTNLLGRAIDDLEGEAFYKKIERYRENLKATRFKENKDIQLKHIFNKLLKEGPKDQYKIAHAFALELELINVCEAVYRTWKLKQKVLPTNSKKKMSLTYVLTAHPTEARSHESLEVLDVIQETLLKSVHNKCDMHEEELLSSIRLLWELPLSKRKRPNVTDEAEYIFSFVFYPDVFDYILQDKPSHEIKLRTWVGGDKDGHPGVDAVVMKECLERSRHYIVKAMKKKLNIVIDDVEKLNQTSSRYLQYSKNFSQLKKDLKKIEVLNKGDGTKVKIWITKFLKLAKKAPKIISSHQQVSLLCNLCKIFPGLVLPIELREDASIIQTAIKNNKEAISKMLQALNDIAGALDITCYARGLVISHCESALDISNACSLADHYCKRKNLPIIPLFESRESLTNSKVILRAWLDDKKNFDRVNRFWNKKFEIMLGYSDSAKQIGVLSGRLMIAKAMRSCDRLIQSFYLTPNFFHGSGGSVARGGGSITEQISWWSNAAINSPKMTIQGEMIQRLFSTKEILNSQCVHMSKEFLQRKSTKNKEDPNPLLEQFALAVQKEYVQLVNDEKSINGLLKASPYHYLSALQLGSRPSKRPGQNLNLNSLRAIPWVLCWTQTRSLLPTWWGVGKAWEQLSNENKEALKQSMKNDKFLSSFVKAMGFSLQKVELGIWKLYFDKKSNPFPENVEKEYESAKKFVFEMAGVENLIWYRPWLGESIELRSSYIHILNLLQILSMHRKDEDLLKETIVGIACGMMTAG